VNGDGQQEVVVASGEQYALLCFSADGKELWRIKSEKSISSSPVLADLDGDGKPGVLIGTNDKALWAVSGAGDILWKAPLEDTVEDSAAPFPLFVPVVMRESDGVVALAPRVHVNAVVQAQVGHCLEGWHIAHPARRIAEEVIVDAVPLV